MLVVVTGVNMRHRASGQDALKEAEPPQAARTDMPCAHMGASPHMRGAPFLGKL